MNSEPLPDSSAYPSDGDESVSDILDALLSSEPSHIAPQSSLLDPPAPQSVQAAGSASADAPPPGQSVQAAGSEQAPSLAHDLPSLLPAEAQAHVPSESPAARASPIALRLLQAENHRRGSSSILVRYIPISNANDLFSDVACAGHAMFSRVRRRCIGQGSSASMCIHINPLPPLPGNQCASRGMVSASRIPKERHSLTEALMLEESMPPPLLAPRMSAVLMLPNCPLCRRSSCQCLTDRHAERVQEQLSGLSFAPEELLPSAAELPPDLAALVDSQAGLGLFPDLSDGLSGSDEEFQQDASLIDAPEGGCSALWVLRQPCLLACQWDRWQRTAQLVERAADGRRMSVLRCAGCSAVLHQIATQVSGF